MKELFILGGPTGVGKTELSLKIAKLLDGEIISADSMQIYKYMDIGSAKIKKEEMQGIPHHLIDFIDPHLSFSVAEYKCLAEEKINEIYSRGKTPIIVGGTGLYINSILYNYDFNSSYKDEAFRKEMENVALEFSKDYLHNLLKDIDPSSYEKLYPNDVKRVIRALEVYKLTGKTITQINLDKESSLAYKPRYYVLTMDREILYKRINERVDIMLKDGLLEEVLKLKNMGLTADMQSMKGIGYKEILLYYMGKVTLEESISAIKQGSRNYAKRQLTWFRKDPNVTFINKEEFSNDEKIIGRILL